MSDLSGRIIAQHSEPLEIALGPEPVLTWVVENATALMERIGRSRTELAAIGMGVPGPVEHSTGQPVNPPIMGSS